MIRLLSPLLLPLLLATQAFAERRPLVVYDLDAEQAHQAVARRVTDALLVYLGQRADLAVIGQAELAVMVAHAKDRQALDTRCATSDCLERLAQATQAELLITGRVGRIGTSWTVTLKLVDTRRKITARGEATGAESESELLESIGPAVDRLLGKGAAAPAFNVGADVKVAVLDLAGHDVSEGLGKNLTQLLILELKGLDGVGVISRDEVRTMLRFETEKQALKCDDDLSCLMEIGGAMGVDYLVTGSIGRLDDTFVLTLKLLDIAEAKAAHRVSESFRGPERDLPEVVRHAARALMGKPPKGVGRLTVQANADAAQIALDGAEPKALAQLGLLELPAGKHGVDVAAEGYLPLYQEVFLAPDRSRELRLELTERPSPWYTKWWTWAIAGAVVAGAVTTTIVLVNQQDPDSGEVRVRVTP